jgi:hypothetical protein
VRARPTAFVVLAVHVDPGWERVDNSSSEHAVVERFSEAGEFAEAESPGDPDGPPHEPLGGDGRGVGRRAG